MEEFISTQSKNDLLKIGLYQIITGFWGLSIFLWSVHGTQTWTTPVIILTLIALLFFAFSIVTGFQCLKMKERALTLSLINQGIQMVGFNIMGYAFKFAPGFFLALGVDMTENFKFTLNAGLSDMAINMNVQSDIVAIDFNLVAIIIFVWLDKINKRIKVEQEIRKDTRFL
jgi:apolipoprotein N-acyltransferase